MTNEGVKSISSVVPINAIGEGTSGLISLEPPLISFESVLIGASVAKEMTVVNRSNCHVQYLLSYRYQPKTDQSQLRVEGKPTITDTNLFIAAAEPGTPSAPLFQISTTTG